MEILSLKSVLLYQLGKALVCDSDTNAICFTDFLRKPGKSASDARSVASKEILDWREIPLTKKQQTPQILYVSPLPQTLVAFGQAIAGADPSAPMQAIANRLDQSHSNLELNRTNEQTLCLDQRLSIEAQLWLEFKIETQKPGWIAFCLSEKGLNRWLQHLQTQPLSTAKTSATVQSAQPLVAPPAAIDLPIVEMLWQAQYTYACCARLLKREHTAKHHLSAPNSQRQRQRHAAERSLVHNLVDTADSLFWIPYRWPTQQYLLLLKRVMPLCQSFERFYSVRLCESEGPYAVLNSQEVAERSLHWSLVSATKNILKVLLEVHLGESAPEQL